MYNVAETAVALKTAALTKLRKKYFLLTCALSKGLFLVTKAEIVYGKLNDTKICLIGNKELSQKSQIYHFFWSHKDPLINDTLCIVSLVLMFPGKGFFTWMRGLGCIRTVTQFYVPIMQNDLYFCEFIILVNTESWIRDGDNYCTTFLSS